MTALLACVGLLFGLLPAAVAQAPATVGNVDFSAGLRAFNQGDYATALTVWRPLAEKGDAGAQYSIGFMYQTGKGRLPGTPLKVSDLSVPIAYATAASFATPFFEAAVNADNSIGIC